MFSEILGKNHMQKSYVCTSLLSASLTGRLEAAPPVTDLSQEHLSAWTAPGGVARVHEGHVGPSHRRFPA